MSDDGEVCMQHFMNDDTPKILWSKFFRVHVEVQRDLRALEWYRRLAGPCGFGREACEVGAPHDLPLDVNAIAKHTVKESDVEVVEDLDE